MLQNGQFCLMSFRYILEEDASVQLKALSSRKSKRDSCDGAPFLCSSPHCFPTCFFLYLPQSKLSSQHLLAVLFLGSSFKCGNSFSTLMCIGISCRDFFKNGSVATFRLINKSKGYMTKKQCCCSPLSNSNTHVWKVLYNAHEQRFCTI